MTRTTKLTLAAALVTAVSLLGCSGSATTTAPPPPALQDGWGAPDLGYHDLHGGVRDLSTLYRDATLVAFMGGECLAPDPELEEIAEESGGSIAVLQVCDSAPRCSPGFSVQEVGFETEASMKVLCDPGRRLRDAYGARDRDIVFVLDYLGVVRDSGFRYELDRLRERAEELDADVEH